MADSCCKKLFLLNGEQKNSENFGGLYKAVSPSVYEVIRIMDGKPLFLEEHYERMVKSLASIDKKVPYSLDEIRIRLKELSDINETADFNAKIVINDFKEDGSCTDYLFFIPTSYPTDEMYRNGVDTDLLSAVRNNPHAKIINQSLRDSADALMKEQKLFEAILVNEKGNITEGSRSNIFFIRNGKVYTCPSEGVLLGVTRQQILRTCLNNGIEVIEEYVKADEISSYQAAFISGTSPKVLPIARIGNTSMEVNETTLRKIMDLYNGEISDYLSAH